jgi:hypothetical protein
MSAVRWSFRLAGLGVAVLLAMLAISRPAITQAPASAATAAEHLKTATIEQPIATATADGFRVVLVAVKGPNGGAAPTATVTIAAYQQVSGSWRQLGNTLLVGSRGGFFWHVITGPHAVRDFSVSNDVPERTSVSLLITPSVGWSRPFRFHVDHGRLVRG